MEIFADTFAGWSFELKRNLTEKDILILLTLLDDTGLLSANKVESYRSENELGKISESEQILADYLGHEGFSFNGTTQIYQDSSIRCYKDIVSLTYEKYINLLSIDIYSDAWMPVGFYEDFLQIESGIINAKRLKESLTQVSQLSFVEKVVPSENEYFYDYMVHQIGFNLFYKRRIDNIKNLTGQDHDKIIPFLLPD